MPLYVRVFTALYKSDVILLCMSCDRLCVEAIGNIMSNKYVRTVMLGLHAIFQFTCLCVAGYEVGSKTKTMFVIH